MAETQEPWAVNLAATDYYALLGLTPTAMPQDIQSAYTRRRAELQALALQSDAQAPKQLRLLDEAFAVLSDPNRRAAYDRARRSSTDSALVLAAQPRSVVAPDAPVPLLAQKCPHCGALNPIQLTVCQECGQQVSRPCPQCGQAVLLNQKVCSRCNTAIEEYDKHRFAEATQIEQQVRQERLEGESRNRALEALNTLLSRQAVVFWLAVLAACIALTAVAWFVAYLFNNMPKG